MPMTLADADVTPVFLLSIYKPILMLLVVAGWGWVVSKLDKDLENLYLQRQLWNGAQIGAGVAGVGLWLLIPWFWVGMFLALVILAGPIAGYIYFRNTKVEDQFRWRLSMDMFTKRMEAAQAKNAQREAMIHLLRKDLSKIEVPSGQDPNVVPHHKLEDLLDFALPRKSDRIDMVIGGNQQVAVVVHVDGFKYPQTAPEPAVALALMNYIKEFSGLDVEERRRKQTGTLHLDAGPLGKHTLAVTTTGSTRDLSLTLRIDPDLRSSVGVNKLGLLESQKPQLVPLLKSQGKVVLVACPPHQGMTSTLYSFLHEHDPYIQSIVTLEEEVAFEIEGVNHHAIEPGTDGPALAEKLEALLRQDPQVVMVSRLADAGIARVAAKHAREIRFYIGLPAEDTFTALKTWIKAVGDAKLATDMLGGIVAQRLIRKLCTTCRAPFKPDPAALKKLNLPADKTTQLYKQSGQVLVKGKPQPCPQCLGMAYRGRVAVFEVMALDPAARQLAAAGEFDQLRMHLRKNRMATLQDTALIRVVDGTTSIAEITRALTPAK